MTVANGSAREIFVSSFLFINRIKSLRHRMNGERVVNVQWREGEILMLMLAAAAATALCMIRLTYEHSSINAFVHWEGNSCVSPSPDVESLSLSPQSVIYILLVSTKFSCELHSHPHTHTQKQKQRREERDASFHLMPRFSKNGNSFVIRQITNIKAPREYPSAGNNYSLTLSRDVASLSTLLLAQATAVF